MKDQLQLFLNNMLLMTENWKKIKSPFYDVSKTLSTWTLDIILFVFFFLGGHVGEGLERGENHIH